MHSLPISALQHLLFCERQCALIHLDQEWTENRFTAEGRVLHERAHDGPDESRGALKTVRGLSVRSDALGIHGVCDVVEFHRDGLVFPVEYKRGKPKAHRADEVQLCAQGLCLEELLDVSISEGALYYGMPRRRTQVVFDESLRSLTCESIDRFRTIIESESLPKAIYEKRKCSACSLMDICQPRASISVKTWLASEISTLQS